MDDNDVLVLVESGNSQAELILGVISRGASLYRVALTGRMSWICDGVKYRVVRCSSNEDLIMMDKLRGLSPNNIYIIGDISMWGRYARFLDRRVSGDLVISKIGIDSGGYKEENLIWTRVW